MTLVEFMATVRGKKNEVQVISALYWTERYSSRDAMTAAEVKAALGQARVAGAKTMNVADVLAKAGSLVDTVGNGAGGAKLWKLTETGIQGVRSLHGLPPEEPEIEHGVSDLRKVAMRITDEGARVYIEEAILCLSVGALRAAIVFTWVGAIADIKTRIWTTGASTVTSAFQKYNSKADIKTHDDLLKFQEVDVLKVAQDLGVIDKAQHKILGQALDLRNQCGHPNKYWPTVAKAKAHVEDIAGILWL